MGAGGIIQQRAAVLLVAVTDPCLYNSLSPAARLRVDAIDGKEPLSRTADDVQELVVAIRDAVNC